MSENHLPSASIVMEWENVRLNGHSRVERVLAALAAQAREFAAAGNAPVELVVTYVPTQLPEAEMCALLQRAFGPAGWPGTTVLAEAQEGDGYYEQKNLGAARATAGIILFLDSDVVPQPGWLAAMLQPFSRWDVSVLAGATACDARSLFGRAVALFWFLPPFPPRRGVQPLSAYFANNLAFRRPLFHKLPFPSNDAYRGQCALQLRALRSLGITLWQQTDARALHPPIAGGASGYLERAWKAGTSASSLAGSTDSPQLAWQTLQADMRLLHRHLRERAPLLQASPLDRAAGRLLGLLYYSIKAAGHFYAAVRRPAYRSARLSSSAPSPTGPR